MKKVILKVFGMAALAAGMMYNVQMSDADNGSGISLSALGSVAVAQSEGGGGGYQRVDKAEMQDGTLVIVCSGSGSLSCS